jgi:hypothetical protein
VQENAPATQLAGIQKDLQHLSAAKDAFTTLYKHVGLYEEQIVRVTNFYHTFLPAMAQKINESMAVCTSSLRELLGRARGAGLLTDPAGSVHECKSLLSRFKEELMGIEDEVVKLARTQSLLQVLSRTSIRRC